MKFQAVFIMLAFYLARTMRQIKGFHSQFTLIVSNSLSYLPELMMRMNKVADGDL